MAARTIKVWGMKTNRRTASKSSPKPTRQASKTRGAKALPIMLADTVSLLAGFARLQVPHGAITDAEIVEVDVVEASEVGPELPSVDRMIRDAIAAGWCTPAKTLSYGLMRAGMSYTDAVAAILERAREGRLVCGAGGQWRWWTSKSRA
jgi:hypothetical protein